MSTSSGASQPSSANSNSFFAWFDRRIAPPLHRFAELAVVAAIREALPWSFLGLLAGLLILIWIVPGEGVSTIARLSNRIAAALLPALAVMAIVLLVLLSLKIARRLRLSRGWYLAACIFAFGLSLPRSYDGNWVQYLRTLGESGLFLAIVVALIVAVIFLLTKYTSLALLATGCIFGLLFAAHISLASVVFDVLQPLGWLGDSYVALVIIVAVETILWTAGVHGPALLAAIVTPVYLTLQTQNAQAFAEHRTMPHIVVVSIFLFVFPGGAGATLPLAGFLALSRVPQLRKLGRVTLLPALVNINEPLLFGLPIVFNPFLAVPFILSPIVLATITYGAIALGWVGRPIYYYPSSIPTLLSTYLATLDVRAIMLVLVNVAVAAAVYFPFVRAYERHLIAKESL